MKEFKLVKVTPEEHKEWCRQQIKEKGLREAVKEQLDELVDICHPLGYMGFSEATERAQNILDLIEVFGQNFGVYRVEQNANEITNIKHVEVLNL